MDIDKSLVDDLAEAFRLNELLFLTQNRLQKRLGLPITKQKQIEDYYVSE